ncbi:MAG TPA: beta-propeller fold lactonase family protein, partial [Candidatus Manganitrophaceae bacterium]|nr:beta-propeller fold lactonase family protein [Candidatus Manganitrophaceae bacterium]
MIAITLLWLLGTGGCGKITGKEDQNNIPVPAAKEGKLYIANKGDGSLLAFDRALFTEGNTPPTRRFPETITGPTGIFLDRANDTLYVANTDHNAILIFENAAALNPPVDSAAATRVISGPNTGLNQPVGIAYDATRERLYVANRGANAIAVFQKDCPQINTLNGNIPPCRTILGAATTLDLPRALAVDAQRDILYVSNAGANSILVYDGASQTSTQGNMAPSRTLTAHSDAARLESMLNVPMGLFSDAVNNRLYVVNTGGNLPAVLVYENAAARSGGEIPERALFGPNTKLSQPVGIEVDPSLDRVYVVNNNNTNNGSVAVTLFNNFNARCAAALCDLTPDATLSGDKTGLANPSGAAYDPARDILYISNTTANNILIYSLDGNVTPSKINSGSGTSLEQPASFFYDPSRDRLYVANFNSFAVGT